MSVSSFQSLLDIVSVVSSIPYHDLPDAENLLLSAFNTLISETDVTYLANQLGIPVTDEFRQIVYVSARTPAP